MEYQRKKVEKIKTEKPKEQRPISKPLKRTAPRLSADRRSKQDVGFDVEDIPMSPRKSSDIRNENSRKAPKHRDVQIGRPTRDENGEGAEIGGAKRIDKNAKGDLKLIIGGRLQRLKERKKTVISLAAVLAITLAILIAAIATPANLIELLQNSLTTWGRGEGLPVSIGGTNVEKIETRGATVFVLTDTRVYAYNRTGKQVQTIQHGYSNPEMYVSDSRTLVYDRGGVKIRVDTLNTNIANKSLAQKITTATLSDNGRVGIITEGEKSASQLVVTNPSFSKFSAWSSTERLTAVTLSRNGKRAAVSAVISSSGTFRSVVYLLDISGETITQVNQIEFSGVPILTLETVGDRVIAVGTDFISSFKFDGGSKVDKTVEYLKRVNFEPDGRILVTNSPSNNVQQTHVTVLNRKFEEKMALTVSGNCDNACISGDGIAAVYGHTLVMYDKNGKEKSETNVGYEGVRIASYRNGTAVISDMQLDYHEYGEDSK